MGPEELAENAAGVQVLDVRYANEWQAGHIKGAVHIPLEELADRARELGKGRPVVTVCKSGARSAEAARMLSAEGYRAENLEGGMDAWAAAGLPFVAGDGGPGTVVEAEEPVDPDGTELSPRLQAVQDELFSVLFAVEKHFGDREPSDEEVLEFLRERMVSEGRSVEEADRIIAGLATAGGAGDRG